MGDLVEQIVPYDRREMKLRDSSYFKLAINPTEAMVDWMLTDWLRVQPDRKILTELLAILKGNMVHFTSFILFGVKQWERIEAEGKTLE